MEELLRIEDLEVSFFTNEHEVKAVAGVDLVIHRGESLGLVGESGCGKTATALAILDLIPSPPGRIKRGRILFKDNDLLSIPPNEMRAIRGNEISMVFQDPMTSLNPVFSVGNQLVEGIMAHRQLSKKEARRFAIEMLGKVGIPSPHESIDSYPHQLSGGMRQRVMIAMALVQKPDLLIADEPTTALDVSIEAQILDLLVDLRREMAMSVLLITHDLGILKAVAERVAIMYLGRIVEMGKTGEIFLKPLHPYTMGLLDSMPSTKVSQGTPKRLKSIPGSVPQSFHERMGCDFKERCSYIVPTCRENIPSLEEVSSGHCVRCFKI